MQIECLKLETPSNVAVSSARSCYFPNGVVKPNESENWSKKDELLDSIFKAGHHTTLMHSNFTLLISGVSRHLIWRLLHSHPHYNSEQISQRYAKMKSDSFYYPIDGDKFEWEEYYSRVFKSYEYLIEKLTPICEARLPKFKIKEAKKKAQEIARYILPQGICAYMYHTVNLLTILRYISSVKALQEAKTEALEFANKLEELLLKMDSSLKPLIDYAKISDVKFFEFDMESFKENNNINSNIHIFDVVKPLDFEFNSNYFSILKNSQMLLDGSNLGGFSSYMKLSLSADAQNQRHRKSVAIRPTISTKRDFYIPNIIKNSEFLQFYLDEMNYIYNFFDTQIDKIGLSSAVYALPNSHNIEIIERNDFNSFFHKAQMRLCFNAQEEIYDLIYEQVKILKSLNILHSDKLLPPCSLRFQNEVFPICPEGVRFCGVKVWKLDFETYKREL